MLGFDHYYRQRLIVTADDFGVSSRANRNILYLVSLGKIDRVAVMPYGKMSPKEIDELARSGVKIDIHLDILHKLDKNRKNRQHVGALRRGCEFLGKLVTGKISTKKISHDWENQIKKFHELFGKYPDGINSHEHVHFFPPFFSVALRLQKKYSIPYVRFGDSVSLRHHTLVAYILHWIHLLDQKVFTRNGFVSSASLVSLDWISDVEKFLQNLPEGMIEIACHPELAEDLEKIRKYF